MKIFLDTAHLPAIEEGKKNGLINGITTNPSLLSKELGNESGKILNILVKICQIMAPNDVSIEITEKEPQKVYSQAKKIADIAPNVVVKIPCHKDYVQTISKLVQEGINVNITLLFSLVQGLLMFKLGVKYISPFIGRLDDIDTDGLKLISDLHQVKKNYGYKTEILAASIRSITEVHEVALIGTDIATIPVSLFNQLIEHPLTDKGIGIFDRDWSKLNIPHFP